MKKIHVLMFVICLSILVGGCERANQTLPPSNKPNNGSVVEPATSGVLPSNEEVVAYSSKDERKEVPDVTQELLNSMTTEEKIGQLVLVGLDGTEPNEHTRKLIETYHVGGFIFYKYNIVNTKQALDMFNNLKRMNAVNKAPLWMSVDEEGGRVTRLPDELIKMPTNQRIGQVNSNELSGQIGQLMGSQLASYGLNMTFAPVLDVNSNPNNPVIGDRSFGNNIDIVSKLGIATMKGIQSEDVVPVVKHFPGHGDTLVDSHKGLPVIKHSIERLRKLEFVPFRNAIHQGAEVVMIAHLSLPKIDPDYPSSMSEIIVNDILRNELGFKGVVITDDMTMGAIEQNVEIGEASVQAVLAGVNIVLVGHEEAKGTRVLKALTSAVNKGTLSGEVLERRVYAILKLKQKYELSDTKATGPRVRTLNTATRNLLLKYGLTKK